MKWLLIACALMTMTACGHRGSLKTPTQAAKDAEKKARAEAKDAEETAPEKEQQ
jgi:predicted small lipoprotein YifL